VISIVDREPSLVVDWYPMIGPNDPSNGPHDIPWFLNPLTLAGLSVAALAGGLYLLTKRRGREGGPLQRDPPFGPGQG
jgi:hypothetical protein